MKNRYLLLAPLLALAAPAAAQHTELIGRAGLGLLRFGGSSAARASAVNFYQDYFGRPNGFTYGQYAGQPGAGFSLGGRVQRVGRRSGLLALEAGYDWLRTLNDIRQLSYSATSFSSRGPVGYEASGTTAFRSQALTGFWGLGHRFRLGALGADALRLDVLAGPEGAYVFGRRERGSGTYDGGKPWTTDQKYVDSGRGDLRLRADLTAWYKKLGLTTSYSYGLLNYRGNLDGGSSAAYSRTLRLGLAYRLR